MPYENQPGTEMPFVRTPSAGCSVHAGSIGTAPPAAADWQADWNDCLNLNCFSNTPGQSFQTTTNQDGTTAESVMIAGLFILSCQEMTQLASLFAASPVAESFEFHVPAFYSGKSKADGAGCLGGRLGREWFRRAYDAFGEPLVRI